MRRIRRTVLRPVVHIRLRGPTIPRPMPRSPRQPALHLPAPRSAHSTRPCPTTTVEVGIRDDGDSLCIADRVDRFDPPCVQDRRAVRGQGISSRSELYVWCLLDGRFCTHGAPPDFYWVGCSCVPLPSCGIWIRLTRRRWEAMGSRDICTQGPSTSPYEVWQGGPCPSWHRDPARASRHCWRGRGCHPCRWRDGTYGPARGTRGRRGGRRGAEGYRLI